jgi:serine/threonine protein kinase
MQIHKYVCLEKLGNGRFGSVYKGEHETTKQFVAIKIEPRQQIQTIKHETVMLNYLHSKLCKHIPKIHWFGVFGHNLSLVMTYYDCSLYDYMTNVSNPAIDIQHTIQSIFDAIKAIHESGVVHRDIKPQNIMITRNTAVLIDFGMATFYIDEHSNHISELQPPKDHLLGTLKYMSYYIHLGKPYSRRDDILSTMYVYMWLSGTLYWSTSDLQDTNSNYSETHILHPKNQYIKGQKEIGCIREYFCGLQSNTDTTSKEYFTDDSRNLQSLLEYVYGLSFYETPKYTILL